MNCLLLNLSKPPFNNLKVRQAAAMAVSSAEYAKVIDQGISPTSNGPFVSGSPYFAPTGYPEPNPTKAKQLVSEVQQETGQPVVVTINHTPDPSATRDAEFIQQQLADSGHAGHPQPGPAGRHHQHRTARHLRGPGVAAVRSGQSRPQLHLLEPDQRGPGLRHQHGPQHRPQHGGGPAQGTPVPGPVPIGPPAYQEVGRLMGSDIPYIWTDRTVWSIGAQPKVQNWNNPTTPAGKPAFGMITGAIWPTQIWLSS